MLFLYTRRFEIPVNRYPTLSRLAANAMKLDAFMQAKPSKQPDSEPEPSWVAKLLKIVTGIGEDEGAFCT